MVWYLAVTLTCVLLSVTAKLAALLAAELGRDVAAADVGLAKKGARHYNRASIYGESVY